MKDLVKADFVKGTSGKGGGMYAAEALLGIDEYCVEYLGAYRDDLFGVQK